MLFLALLPQEGQPEQFEELVARYEKKIFNLMLRLVGDHDEAADLTQDTFLAAFRSFEGFRGDSSPYTWLYRIALNCVKNRFKRVHRLKSRERSYPDEEGIPIDKTQLPHSSCEPPDSHMQRKELKRLIETAINGLPNDYKIVVVLRDLHGMSYQDIVDSTGLSMDVVKTRLSRARSMIRKKLGPYLSG